MDRLYYLDADIVLGPTITYYRGTRLYDGDSKVCSQTNKKFK